MTALTAALSNLHSFHWDEYLELCKPKVVALIMFTAIVGMLLAVTGPIPWDLMLIATVGIGLASGSAAAINHVVDEHADAKMGRTKSRPLPTGKLNRNQALVFAVSIGVVSMLMLYFWVNPLTALLTFFSLIGYAIIYTMYLKRATPQNIVIGGAAGAAPPVLGWVSMTGELHGHALLLFLIIFVWTPPHFWALAIHRSEDYARADIPMLPVTHGHAFTRLQILLYTVLLCVITIMPYVVGMMGLVYLFGVIALNAGFLLKAWLMFIQPERKELPMQTFGYSIIYLMALFALLMIDHFMQSMA